MLKRSLLIFAVLLAAVSFVSGQTTDQTDKPYEPTETTQPESTLQQNAQVSGTISKIDHKKMMISLKIEATGETKDFTFTETTTFLKDEKSITHKDLIKGDRVSLEVDSANSVLKLNVLPKESMKEEAESEEPEKQD